MESGEESVAGQPSLTAKRWNIHGIILAVLAVAMGVNAVYWGWRRLDAGRDTEVGLGLVVFGIALALSAVGLVSTAKWSFWLAMVGAISIAGIYLWALLALESDPILISTLVAAAVVPVYLLAVRRSFGIGT